LENLHGLAAQNPNLSAASILKMLADYPEALDALEKRIGKNRAAFLLKILEDADKAQRERGIPLATFLAPIAQSYENFDNKPRQKEGPFYRRAW
jgi:flagellum-specific peptidoglycan hydrolase FlgJ